MLSMGLRLRRVEDGIFWFSDAAEDETIRPKTYLLDVLGELPVPGNCKCWPSPRIAGSNEAVPV